MTFLLWLVFFTLSTVNYEFLLTVFYFVVCLFCRCSELLVMKAELELMQGEKDESRTDLDIVRNLLERSTGL